MSGWVAGATIVSGFLSADAASSAADVQAGAADRSGALQRETAKEQLALQQRIYEENVARQQPFYNAGVNALPELVQASKYTPFGMDQFQQDPGYAFRIKEGQKRLDRSAAARGGLISGGALKAATEYGQEMGSQEYMNAFNRYQTERAARLQPLQSLTGMSQTTANTLGTAGQNYAGSSANIAGNMAANVGEAYQGAANARASGYVGGANALTSGLGTYLNYSQGQNMINSMRRGGGGGGGVQLFNPDGTPTS
jgi:hypothetical protein